MTLGAPAMSLEPTSRSVGQAPEGLSERLVDAATAYRTTDEIVERLDREHQQVLRAFYVALPPSLRRVYGDLGDLAGPMMLLTQSAADLASMVVKARRDRDTNEKLRGLKETARKAVEVAHRAYLDERRLREAVAEKLRSDMRRRRIEALFRSFSDIVPWFRGGCDPDHAAIGSGFRCLAA